MRSIWRNQTGIEDWILEKANYRRKDNPEDTFYHPYDLGKLNNIWSVLTWTCIPIGDGIGKMHALKKYDHFALILAAFGEVPDRILPQLCNFTKFLLR